MPTKQQAEYRGWDIELSCRRSNYFWNLFGVRRYTASGKATLKNEAIPGNWFDSRPQTISLGARDCATRDGCVKMLMLDIMALIDALEK